MTSIDFVDVGLHIPEIEHSTDNAIMIAVAGYMRFMNKGKVWRRILRRVEIWGCKKREHNPRRSCSQ